MSINTRNERGVTIIEPAGRITIGVGDVALRRAINDALAGGASNILVDLGNVDMMDSSGLGELVRGLNETRNQGGSLRLCALQPRVRQTLDMAGRTGAFDIYDDEIDALNSFR